ncbi:MAG: UdgX family uracil-DNA binding protein [Acidobacteriota bacterium]|nr:UdgX family uracil-DNA binding protein [Acidobacteriota bacterium]
MIEAAFDGSWEGWRRAARPLLAAHVDPAQVIWTTGPALPGLFSDPEDKAGSRTTRVPAPLIADAKVVACHRDPEPWRVLYRLFFRVTHGERHLPEIASDPDVLEFRRMEKSVRRDIHKMHAFVRFRKTPEDEYIAWYRPDHRIVRINPDFFVRRFGSMKWAILTPDESVCWDLRQLRFGPGMPRSEAPADDELEPLWRTYYASIFNPARVNTAAMIKELPVRHWATLPEAALIPGLLAAASGRVERMEPVQSAAPFVPASRSLKVLREAARRCEGCDLYLPATQTVFGEGPKTARLVLVGEQPGDREDLEGKPFVGPAGDVLSAALEAAGIQRKDVYLTNAVKHFKFTERGKRRIHSTPRGPEIAACRPWLEEELKAIQPHLVVCLGGTAGQSVMGRAVRVQAERGQFFPHHLAREAMITVHPSFILRIPDRAQAAEERARFAADLRKAAERAEKTSLPAA